MKTKFKDIIGSSSLAGEDKEMWEVILSFVTDKEAKVFLDFIGDGNDKTKKLAFLTTNISSKAKAFAGKNTGEFEKILSMERDELRSL